MLLFRYSISVQALPQRVEIVDCEKRRGTSRFYAYVIEVTRKDKSKYYIFRRYRQFDKVCTRLEERFPIEAGSLRASDRTLPTLPGNFEHSTKLSIMAIVACVYYYCNR